MFHQIGPRVQAIAVADDCKPALRALLEAEFEKVSGGSGGSGGIGGGGIGGGGIG
jgi:hypothetical protein